MSTEFNYLLSRVSLIFELVDTDLKKYMDSSKHDLPLDLVQVRNSKYVYVYIYITYHIIVYTNLIGCILPVLYSAAAGGVVLLPFHGSHAQVRHCFIHSVHTYIHTYTIHTKHTYYTY